MSDFDSERLKRIKEYLIYLRKNDPEKLKELIGSMTELSSMVENGGELGITMFGNPNTGNEIGGPKKTLSLPQFKDSAGDKGFSNYFLLAVFAFIIQFAITMICIVFYKG